MNPTYEILIKLEADLQGGKDVAQALKDAKTAATDLGGRYDTTKSKTDALNQSKQRLRDTIKGLSFQIPVLGSLMEKFSSGLGGAVAVAVGAFALIRSEIRKFEESLEDPPSTTNFQEWIKAQREGYRQLGQQVADTLEQINRFDGYVNDPQRLANQEREQFQNRARLETARDQALVKRGVMSEEEAARRGANRDQWLADNLEMVSRNEAYNTDVARNDVAKQLKAQQEKMAGMLSPADLAARINAKAAEIEAERKRLEEDTAYVNSASGKFVGVMTGEFSERDQAISARRRRIDVLEQQKAAFEATRQSDEARYKSEAERLGILDSRLRGLKRTGEGQVFSRPVETANYQAETANRRAINAINTATPQELQAAVNLALRNHTDVIVNLINLQTQRLKQQRTP